MTNQRLLALTVCIGAALMIAAQAAAPAFTRPAPPQDLMMLDRRVSAIEQRIYSLESRLNQVEQQSRMTQRPVQPPPAAAAQSTELRLLRSELEIIASRVRLIECGVVQLDERTTPERVREARKKAGQADSSCRLHPDNPIQFPPWR
ncbi:MAG TPA: hypothetical protein VNQ79_06430 [Blastocatellia bacterium]|nr:hypothetical protein [Blastocatellia bacterium]